MKNIGKKSRSLRHRARSSGFEELESRQLLSANVTALVLNGELYIQENGGVNIVVDQMQLSVTQFRISPGDGATTINGHAGASVFSGVNGIFIGAFAGHDTVTMQNASVNASVQIAGFCGHQAVTLNAVTIGGNFSLITGGGGNSTDIEYSHIAGNLSVAAGAGSCAAWDSPANPTDVFTLNSSAVGNNISIFNAGHSTSTTIEDASIGNNLTVINSGGGYDCAHGAGAISVANHAFIMTGCSIGNSVSIVNASTSVSSSTIMGNVTVIAQQGAANFIMDASLVMGNLTVAGGRGAGNVTVTNGFIANNATIEVAPGGNVVISPDDVGGVLTIR